MSDVTDTESEDMQGSDLPDPQTLVLRMRQPVPYTPKLVSHQFFRPVPRQAIERFGSAWTRPEHIVVSGAFTLETWRPYDIMVLKRNPAYYDVRLGELIAYDDGGGDIWTESASIIRKPGSMKPRPPRNAPMRPRAIMPK